MCNKYVPLADDLQITPIQELIALKQVNENEVDALFTGIEGIIDQYVKARPVDDLSDRWVRAAMLKRAESRL